MYFVELEPVFNNEDMVLPLDFTFDMSECELYGGNPFGSPVRITGEIHNSTGIVSIKAKADFTLNLTCDRCAVAFDRDFSVPVEHVLVTELNDEGNDEYIVVDSLRFDAEPLIREDILLSMPTKVLCRDDCLGICPRCGKDLNDGPCDCKKEADPRWDALLQLTQEDQ